MSWLWRLWCDICGTAKKHRKSVKDGIEYRKCLTCGTKTSKKR